MLKQRLLTALCLIPLVLLLLLLPQKIFAAVVLALVLLAGWEYLGLIKWQSPRLQWSFYISLAIGFGIGLYFPLIILLLATVGWIIATIAVIKFPLGEAAWHQHQIIKGVVGWFLLVPFGTGLLVLHQFSPGFLWVLLCCAMVWAADTGAYFAGRLMGKQPLAPLISPKKTVEGLYGGVIFALLVAAVFVLCWGLPVFKQALFAVLCLLVILLSVVGDLVESIIKRWMQVKDSGNILPGHGGILDRIDSLTAAIPVFALGISLLMAS